MPIAEASEQTIVQRVVPFEKQGRVFGFAASLESAAAPVSSFLVGPLAQFWLIPYMNSEAGKDSLGWLLGPGEARGIALAFLGASSVLLVVVLLAFVSRPYRRLSAAYASAPPPLHTESGESEVQDAAAAGGIGDPVLARATGKEGVETSRVGTASVEETEGERAEADSGEADRSVRSTAR
jgi:MFS transporter, DHA3 family, multidrug efflux protein